MAVGAWGTQSTASTSLGATGQDGGAHPTLGRPQSSGWENQARQTWAQSRGSKLSCYFTLLPVTLLR